MAAIQQILLGTSGAAVGAAVTWNPADKAALIVLSGGDLIAGRTGANTYQSVRATQYRTTGKHYFEGLVGAGTSSSMMIGLGAVGANINSFVGSDVGGFGYNASNGGKYNSGGLTAFGATYSPGDVIGIAYDAATGFIWFAKNNVYQASGNPAGGTSPAFSTTPGSTLAPMCSILEGASGQTWVGRFMASAFTYAPPAGFSAWNIA